MKSNIKRSSHFTPMTNLVIAVAALLVCIPAECQAQGGKTSKHVLVVTTTTGFRHSSIPTAEKIIGQLAEKSGAFTVDYARVDIYAPEFKTADGKTDTNKLNTAISKVLTEKMSLESLKNYDAVIFANTTGDLPLPDRQGFLDWIKSGKGFVGIHSAADTFHGFQPFIEMLGGEFKTHGAQVDVEAINQDKDCPACRHLGPTWKVFDEIYQFKNFERTNVHGLLTLDKHPNNKTPGDYPVAWCKEYGKRRFIPAERGAELLARKNWWQMPGRVFYTSFGHREDIWEPNSKDQKGEIKNAPEIAEAYQKHILGAIKWALGLEKGDAIPQVTK